MTYKQIEEAREVRLWITQVIVPAAMTVGGLMLIPEVRETVVTKASEFKTKVKAKFRR